VSLVTGAVWSFTPTSGSVALWFFNITPASSAVLISTVSDFVTSLVCALGFTWVIYRSQHLTLENLHPRAASRLLEKHTHLLSKPSELMKEGVIWYLLTLILLVTSLVNWSLGLTNTLVLGFLMAVGFSLTLALVKEEKTLKA